MVLPVWRECLENAGIDRMPLTLPDEPLSSNVGAVSCSDCLSIRS
jgi:hypothetical protein